MDWPSQGFWEWIELAPLMLRPSDSVFVLIIGGGMIAACSVVALCGLWTIHRSRGLRPSTEWRGRVHVRPLRASRASPQMYLRKHRASRMGREA